MNKPKRFLITDLLIDKINGLDKAGVSAERIILTLKKELEYNKQYELDNLRVMHKEGLITHPANPHRSDPNYNFLFKDDIMDNFELNVDNSRFNSLEKAKHITITTDNRYMNILERTFNEWHRAKIEEEANRINVINKVKPSISNLTNDPWLIEKINRIGVNEDLLK